MLEALVMYVGMILFGLACMLLGGAVFSYTLSVGARGWIAKWFLNTAIDIEYGWKLFERKIFKNKEKA